MNKNVLIAIALVVVLGVVGLMLMNTTSPSTDDEVMDSENTVMEEETVEEDAAMEDEDSDDDAMMMEEGTVTVTLDEVVADVAQTGTAVLKDVEDGVMVTVTVTGYTTDLPQPAHIHTGACPTPGDVVYPLENVVNGTSTTTLTGVTLEQLETELPLALNVHKSADESSVYTACGDVEF